MRTFIQALPLVVVCGICYMLGGLSTGLFVSLRMKGTDVRDHGSGSSGATNVLRVVGAKAGLITFIGDFMKGVVAGLLGRLIAGWVGFDPALCAAICGFCAIIGHIWPVMLGFKGGKGVATAGGLFVVVTPLPGIITIVACIICVAVTRIVSLSSMFGAVVYLLVAGSYGLVMNRHYLFFFSFITAATIIFAHRSNVARLVKGTENVLDFDKLFGKKDRGRE